LDLHRLLQHQLTFWHWVVVLDCLIQVTQELIMVVLLVVWVLNLDQTPEQLLNQHLLYMEHLQDMVMLVEQAQTGILVTID
tara:strand:+ start:43 stop:285 length:243 start_codon:yes stop_codon:yes gene_type:complete